VIDEQRPSKSGDQMAVPSPFRATLESIVDRLVQGDYAVQGVPGLVPVDTDSARQMKEAVEDYGDVHLARLGEQTWESSVAMWTGQSWQVLVDMQTEEEGRSDLALEVNVREAATGFQYDIHLLYVP
jgi:hypothetical protein